MQLNCVKKNCTKNWIKCSLAQHEFLIRFVSLFFFFGGGGSVLLLVRVTLVNKNKAVVCCLLATSAIILSKIKKIKPKTWSKKWYFKRNISCGAHLLNELLETDVEGYINYLRMNEQTSWCRQVNWGNCGIPWVNCAVLCMKDEWKGWFWGLSYCMLNCTFYSVLSIRYDVTQ